MKSVLNLNAIRFLILLAVSWLPFTAHANGDRVNNGGESIDIGGATRVFDVVEFDEPFFPGQTGEAWTQVSTQLGYLATKLPHTAEYLRSFFLDGATVWWFVNVQLKPIDDSGSTNAVISYRREQIAANQAGIIQIRKDLWNQLDANSKATLLVHEMLWSAIGRNFIGNGSNVRTLSRYLLHPGLQNFAAINVVQYMQQILTDQASPLFQWIRYDQESAQGNPIFTVREVTANLRKDVVVTVASTGSVLRGLQFTPKNPNPRHSRIGKLAGANGVGGQIVTGTYAGAEIDPRELCDDLGYAGTGGWRLPTSAEIDALHALRFRELSYLGRALFENDRFVIGDLNGSYEGYLDAAAALHCTPGRRGDTCRNGLARHHEGQNGYTLWNVPYFCVKSN